MVAVKRRQKFGRARAMQHKGEESNNWQQIEKESGTREWNHPHSNITCTVCVSLYSIVHLMKHCPGRVTYIYSSCCRRTPHIAWAHRVHMTLKNKNSLITWTGRLCWSGE
jgi:hypothetical protein